jgi:hypothetical protein
MNDAIQSLIGSRRFIALAVVAVLGVFREQLGIPQEAYDKLRDAVYLWAGLETVRSSKDGSGLLGNISLLIDSLTKAKPSKDDANVPAA